MRGGVRPVRVDVPPASDLVVEPGGRHAYLVSGGTFVRVDLGTLGVAYVHRAPRLPRQRVAQESRSALWLGRGLIASFGSDFVAARGTNEPVGLRLIDTRRRSVRLVDGNMSAASLVGGVLLATGAPRIGLVAYDLRGRRRFQLFRGRSVGVAQSYGGRVYLSVSGKPALQVVDVGSGRVLAARRSPLPLMLLTR